MLRTLVIALFVANLAWWAWHTPLLGLGSGDSAEREPQRLARQVNPEQIRVLPAQEAPPPSPSPSAPAAPASLPQAATALQCLEAGPLDEADFAAAKRDLQGAGVSADGWVDMRREKPASHAVYMGRFADDEQLQRKREELQHIGVPFENYTASMPAGLAPGITLGRYATVDQAQARLKELQAKGVRTARVLLLTPASMEHTLRVDQANPDLQASLTQAASNAGRWRACTGPAP